MPRSEKFQQLPAPWDRIFSLFTRLFVWGLMISIIYILRPFFLLIFLTFVFAYIQNHAVDGLKHRFQNRVYRVTVVFIVFLGVIVGTFYFLAPHVRNQMGEFSEKYPQYMRQADDALYKWIDGRPSLKRMIEGGPEIGEGKTGAGEEKEPGGAGGGQQPDTPNPKDREPTQPNPEKQGSKERRKIVEPFVIGLLSGGEQTAGDKNSIETYAKTLQAIVGGLVGITSSFLLAILFSFLIVLDLPSLRRGVAGLAKTRLDFIYEEAADNIYQFGLRLGRALEAQLIIAICNMILTAIGIYFLGIGSIVFLSTIVFFCSFVPVAGVFISSAPICLLALQTGGENSVQLMLLAIAMVLAVHTVEAYILNPKIYGHHLRMNAVLVLIVLTIAGKLVGVWGLVLGLPIVNYFFVTAIRRKPGEIEESQVVPAVAADPRATAAEPPAKRPPIDEPAK